MSKAIQRRDERHWMWSVISYQSLKSRVGEFAAWLRNGPAEFARGFDPFVNDDFGVCDCFSISLAVGHAAGELGNLDNETVVFLAPVNDQFVTRSYSMSILYFKSISRTCFTC
jgi:hypothetical protein